MFHELILTLGGYTGDVFQYDGDIIMINKNLQLPLIHPSELQILTDILEIATLYKKIQEFVHRKQQVEVDEKQGPVGLYISSVSNGINIILEKYLDAVSRLELGILEDPYITVTHVRAKMEPFRQLFTVLVSLIAKIEVQSKSSAVIVEIVKSHFDVNIPVQDELKPLIPWTNKILYKQITNWVLFGSLFDYYDEFFIQKKSQSVSISNSNDSDKSVLSTNPSKDDNGNEKYFVDYSVVPSHISVALTEKILFVGHAIGILRKSEKARLKLSLSAKQKVFFEKLNALPMDTFRTEDLDSAIGELATAVGKDLHHLVVTETDLSKHLGIVKDFYLTGRGELFHDFLLNIKELPLGKKSLNADISQAFTVAAGRVQVQEEILQRIQISVHIDPSHPIKSLSHCIANMTLKMEDEWPLDILFTHESVKKYNELFVFLLQVRRLQMDLNLLWMNTRKVFRFPIPKGPAELRNIMSHFIDHLQHYLQEDVLENEFQKLSDTITKSDNFEQIRVAHARFQSSILTQSFRHKTQISHFVEETIEVCNQFVRYMNKQIQLSEMKEIPINEGASKEILQISTDFKRHMDLLLNLLQAVSLNPQSGQHLGQFLLRLDFNSYFSSVEDHSFNSQLSE